MLLFIVNGMVAAHHEDSQQVDPSAYHQYDDSGAMVAECHVMHVPDGTEVEMHAPPPALTPEIIQSTRVQAKRRVVAILDELDERIADLVPRAERDGWYPKSIYAEAIRTGQSTTRQEMMLQREMARTGEAMPELIDHIIETAIIYEGVSGDVAGVRRRCHKEIDQANTIATIEAVVHSARVDAEDIYQAFLAAQQAAGP